MACRSFSPQGGRHRRSHCSCFRMLVSFYPDTVEDWRDISRLMVWACFWSVFTLLPSPRRYWARAVEDHVRCSAPQPNRSPEMILLQNRSWWMDTAALSTVIHDSPGSCFYSPHFNFCDLQAFFFNTSDSEKTLWLKEPELLYRSSTTCFERQSHPELLLAFSQRWLNSEQQHQLTREMFLFTEQNLQGFIFLNTSETSSSTEMLENTQWFGSRSSLFPSIHHPTIQPSSGNHHLRLNYTSAWKPWRRLRRRPPPQCEGRVPPKTSNHASREHSP